jgi:hypothetical protein
MPQPTNFSRPDRPLLADEVLDGLERAHYTLQREVAATARNGLRVEVRLFRGLLQRIIAWAGNDPSLEPLSQRVRWWEWSWYEREYIDSNFSDLRIEDEPNDERTLEYIRATLHIWLPTIDYNALTRDVSGLLSVDNNVLPGLRDLAQHPRWDEMRLALSHAGPQARVALLDALLVALTFTNSASYTYDALHFLRTSRADFALRWVVHDQFNQSLLITPLFADDIGVLPSSGRLAPEAEDWLLDQIARQHSDAAVTEECKQDMQMLIEEILDATDN